MKNREIKRCFITKYSLTQGIIECDMEITDIGVYGKPPGWYMACGFHGNDVCFDLDSAMIDAERRRLKKIESLKKQIIKLEKLEIKVQK